MEKLIGKLVQTDGVTDFVTDFLAHAGDMTANARLDLEASGMTLEIICERNVADHVVAADGLEGGGHAVGSWADSQGYVVLDNESDYVTIEAKPGDTAKIAASFATFLAPAGRWRISELSVRRKL